MANAEVSRSGDAVVVTVSGDVDAYSAPDVRAVLDSLALVAGVRVVLDLRPVTFLDSSGLGAVVQLHQRLVGVGGRLHLVCEGATLRLVELMHLGDVMGVSTTIEEAVLT